MEKILKIIHHCNQIMPRRYYYADKSYIVWEKFLILFSRDIDLLFEDLSLLLDSIDQELNSHTKWWEDNIMLIKNFSYDLYLQPLYSSLKNEINEYQGQEKNIEKNYIELLDEINQLVEEFKTQFTI